MVISTGITLPAWAWVAALYCRQKSMMFTAWGPSAVPTGGAGVAWPAVSSILMTAATRRRRLGWGGMWWLLLGGSELLDLVEGELDRGLAAEDRHQHLELLLVGEDLGDFLLGQRGGLGPGADEAGHTGGVAHHVPGVVVEVHADQQVAGEDLAGDDLLLAALDLHDVFHGDDDLEDLLLHVHRGDAALEVGLVLVLVARVGVDHVPVPKAVAGAGRAGCGLGVGLGLGLGAHDAPVSRRRWRARPSRTGCRGRR